MKITRIAFAIGAMMAASSASAFDVYVGGASALRDTMPRFLDLFCEPHGTAARAVYRFNTGPGTDSDRRVFTCTFKTNATLTALGLSGDPVRVFHSVEPGNSLDADLGGSITGVVPLLYTNNSNAQLNYLVLPGENINGVVGSCVADGTEADFGNAPRNKCTSQTKRADTEVGFSDVEPAKFTALFSNLPTAPAVPNEWKSFNPSPLNSPNAVAVFGQMFGIAATDAAIAAGITNLSHDQLAAVLSGDVATWDRLGFTNTDPVFVCRRTPGSGTQATFNARVSGRGCGNPAFLQQTPIGDEAGFFPNIDENNTTSAVKTCLVNHNAAGNKAIGILSLENKNNEAGWDIINYNSVDVWNDLGVGDTNDGTVDNVLEDKAISGVYDLWVESTVQHRVGLGGDQLGFYNLIAQQGGLPSITLALPGNVALAAQVVNSSAPNTLAGGHLYFTRNTDSCNGAGFQP
jgi:hypothetical protein